MRISFRPGQAPQYMIVSSERRWISTGRYKGTPMERRTLYLNLWRYSCSRSLMNGSEWINHQILYQWQQREWRKRGNVS